VSYRWVEPDQSWVRNHLVPALKNAGLRVCLDVEDFVPGRDLIFEMTRAGAESSRALCVLSPDYFAGNRMVAFESLMARRLDASGMNSRLIPLILRSTEMPEWIRGLIPVDWTRSDSHLREWRKLLAVLEAKNVDGFAPASVDAADSSLHTDPTAAQLRASITSASNQSSGLNKKDSKLVSASVIVGIIAGIVGIFTFIRLLLPSIDFYWKFTEQQRAVSQETSVRPYNQTSGFTLDGTLHNSGGNALSHVVLRTHGGLETVGSINGRNDSISQKDVLGELKAGSDYHPKLPHNFIKVDIQTNTGQLIGFYHITTDLCYHDAFSLPHKLSKQWDIKFSDSWWPTLIADQEKTVAMSGFWFQTLPGCEPSE
jgi:TIR domain